MTVILIIIVWSLCNTTFARWTFNERKSVSKPHFHILVTPLSWLPCDSPTLGSLLPPRPLWNQNCHLVVLLNLTGITIMFLSKKILSAAGVVGPLAPSAIICNKHPRRSGSIHWDLIFALSKYRIHSPLIWEHGPVKMKPKTPEHHKSWPSGTAARGSPDLGLDVGGILFGQLLLAGRRNQDVAVSLQDVALVGLGIGEAHNGAMLLIDTCQIKSWALQAASLLHIAAAFMYVAT